MSYPSKPQDSWHQMAGVPERVGTCAKLRQGQLLMQRYQWGFEQMRYSPRYTAIAQVMRNKGVELARRMVEHAKTCPTCQRERVLDSDIFYGVIKGE